MGEDGATHHGLYDIAYLSCIPDLVVTAPLNEVELRNMMYTFQLGINIPVSIRYPRGRGFVQNWKLPFEKIEIGKAKQLRKGKNVAVLSTGTIGNNVIKALDDLKLYEFSHYHFPFVKPLDEGVLHEIGQNYQQIITVEEGCLKGGLELL